MLHAFLLVRVVRILRDVMIIYSIEMRQGMSRDGAPEIMGLVVGVVSLGGLVILTNEEGEREREVDRER